MGKDDVHGFLIFAFSRSQVAGCEASLPLPLAHVCSLCFAPLGRTQVFSDVWKVRCVENALLGNSFSS